MIVSVISMKNLHNESIHNSYYEELLHFGCKSVTNLITKLPAVEDKLVDKIFQLFLSLKSLRIRNSLSIGLQSSLTTRGKINPDVLDIVCNLNKLRRGAADLELDYDSVIKTIQQLIEAQDVLEGILSNIELQAISYSVMFLL